MKYLFWAYTFTWLLLFFYIFSIGFRQGKISQEIKWLKGLVQDSGSGPMQKRDL